MKHILEILLFAAMAFTTGAATVNELIPKLADPTVGNRYAAQMELQALAANASKPGNETDRASFGTLLATKAADASVPQPARVWIVRQLEYMGRGEAVPALTALLSEPDTELRECARRALEKNPDLKATESLRAALQKSGDTAWKIGLMRSLSEKHDANAVPLIAPLLNDPQLGGPAAKALGDIATPAAVAALWGAMNTQPLAEEALVTAANHSAPVDAKIIALRLYEQSKISLVRAAALTILAKTDRTAAAKIAAGAIFDSDIRLQKAAVDVTPAGTLAVLLPKLPVTAKVFALRAIDTSAEKAAIDCVADKDTAVRGAALEALGRLGTADSVPVLIKVAATGTDTEKTIAVASLAEINGSGTGKAIAQQAAQGEVAVRVVAINALGAHADQAELPALLRYASEVDTPVSKEALAAIGKFGGDESLDGLVKLVLGGKLGAKDALLSVSNRSQDKSLVGRKLVAQAQGASGPQLAGVLDVMALVGGPETLATVVTFATTGSEEVKDGAVRALCNWREWSAVKPLLAIASMPEGKQVHQVLAIQAVCRLVKVEEKEPVQTRLDATLRVLQAVRRPQEKTQVVSALATIKDSKAADAIISLLADPAMKPDAGFAAITLADALRKSDLNTSKKLAEAVKNANISPDLNRRADDSLRSKGGPNTKSKKK